METKHRETKSDITPPSGRHVLAPYTIQWALRRPSGRHPFREPWRVRGLGRPWRSRGFRKPLRVHLRARGPSPRLSLYGRSSTTLHPPPPPKKKQFLGDSRGSIRLACRRSGLLGALCKRGLLGALWQC